MAVASRAGNHDTTCLRLFDKTLGTPLSESEVCHTHTVSGQEQVRERSPSFTLPEGEHEYTVEAKWTPTGTCCGVGGLLYATRIIAQWTEVGP